MRLSGREKGSLGRRTRRGLSAGQSRRRAPSRRPPLLPQPPPARLLAGFALRSNIRPPPPRARGPLPAPRRPGHPPLRPGRASRAPLGCPFRLSPFCSIPPLPRWCSPSPGRIPGVGSSPGEWKIGEAERVYRDAACALPAATRSAPDQRPPAARAATKRPLQRAVPLCARRADTPEFAPLFSAGTGEGRGKGRGRAEGSGRKLPARGALDAGAGCGPGGPASRGPTSPASLAAAARH